MEPPATDRQENRRRVARRAATLIRRLVARHALTRMVTLTWAGEGCHDYRQARREFNGFMRRLRTELGEPQLPYVAVLEVHPGGHGFHWHLALGRFVDYRVLRRVWGLGIIDVRKIRADEGGRASARAAGRYLSKYLVKAIGVVDDQGDELVRTAYRPDEFPPGAQRWVRAEQLPDGRRQAVFRTREEARQWAAGVVAEGDQAAFTLRSEDVDSWGVWEVWFWR